MVLGFIVYWPIGLRSWLEILQKKSVTRRHYFLRDFLRARKWGNWTTGRAVPTLGYSVKEPRFGMGSTGNRAFDEWRATELARLEEERQKLVAAEREFAEFMEISATQDRRIRAVHG